ncbi:MAG: hypothetical protein Q9218_007873 [Villophora microphyllina]
MHLFVQVVTVALAIAPAAAIGRVTRRGSPSPPAPTSSYTYGTAIGGALDMPTPTTPPDVNRAKGLDAAELTVHIINSYGTPLKISYNSNEGSPTILGNPGADVIAQATDVVVPRDFAGAILVGETWNPGNSKIEVSFVSNQGYRPGLDVSYVDGFSVPLVCSCSGVPVTGCNINLFTQGHQCPDQGWGPCYNPARSRPDGPADPFFQQCQGAAYTFPGDIGPNAYGKCDAGDIQCCIGVFCPAPSIQHGKRSLDWIEGNKTSLTPTLHE